MGTSGSFGGNSGPSIVETSFPDLLDFFFFFFLFVFFLCFTFLSSELDESLLLLFDIKDYSLIYLINNWDCAKNLLLKLFVLKVSQWNLEKYTKDGWNNENAHSHHPNSTYNSTNYSTTMKSTDFLHNELFVLTSKDQSNLGNKLVNLNSQHFLINYGLLTFRVMRSLIQE